MTTAFILGHLGLGDQIICNGLIRDVASRFTDVYLPVKQHNVDNIKDMLKDVSNINIVVVKDDQDMLRAHSLTERFVDKTIRFGVFAAGFMKDVKTFDESFYKQAGVDYDNRWFKFHYVSNYEKQGKLLNKVFSDFIFVHDDSSRQLNVREDLLNKNYPIFRPDHKLGSESETTIFDYLSVLQEAKEIHCIDSSFACLVDHISSLYYKPKFLHRYVRKENHNPFYKNNWTIYE